MPQRKTREVKNHDIVLLQNVRYIKQEILSLQDREQWERDRLYHISQIYSPVSGKSGGAPRGIDEALATLESLATRHNALVKRYRRAICKAEQILNGIRSQQMRTFVVMMYLDGVSDSEVKSRLGLTRWQYEHMKDIVESAANMESVPWHDRYTEAQEGASF